MVSSLMNLVSGGGQETYQQSHWFSESGIIDLYLMLGPSPKDVNRQYGAITGVTPLPQVIHLLSFNSLDEMYIGIVVIYSDSLHYFPISDLLWAITSVDGITTTKKTFIMSTLVSTNMISLTMFSGWTLSILTAKSNWHHEQFFSFLWYQYWLVRDCYTNRYFTWDPVKFPDALEMTNNLTSKGRKLVTIVDPHIKRDSSYFFHQHCENNDLYVKDKDGKIYEGWCWPGAASYPDYFNPAVVDYWASQYALDKYHGTKWNMHHSHYETEFLEPYTFRIWLVLINSSSFMNILIG